MLGESGRSSVPSLRPVRNSRRVAPEVFNSITSWPSGEKQWIPMSGAFGTRCSCQVPVRRMRGEKNWNASSSLSGLKQTADSASFSPRRRIGAPRVSLPNVDRSVAVARGDHPASVRTDGDLAAIGERVQRDHTLTTIVQDDGRRPSSHGNHSARAIRSDFGADGSGARQSRRWAKRGLRPILDGEFNGPAK